MRLSHSFGTSWPCNPQHLLIPLLLGEACGLSLKWRKTAVSQPFLDQRQPKLWRLAFGGSLLFSDSPLTPKNTKQGYPRQVVRQEAARDLDLEGRVVWAVYIPTQPTPPPFHVSMWLGLLQDLLGPSIEFRQAGRPTTIYRVPHKVMCLHFPQS